MTLRRILVSLGTRPEAIKLAPVILALRSSGMFDVVVCSTGQHAHMVRPISELFGFTIDHDLSIMQPSQSLNYIVSATLQGMDKLLEELRPDHVVVQGDTSTTLASALAAFQRAIPVHHVEAGLRTGNLESPFPEEANRTLVSRIAHYHFAPTQLAADNLLAEGVAAERVFNVGNTVIDAARLVAQMLPERAAAMMAEFGLTADIPTVLFTMHRRENHGLPIEQAFKAIADFARANQVRVVFPVHPSPKVRGPAFRILSEVPGVTLCQPLRYDELILLLQCCRFVITDSGGLVEEASAFGRPVMILRDTTERSEAVAAGGAALCGTEPDRILGTASELLAGGELFRAMSGAPNPFGDGRAASRIVDTLIADECRYDYGEVAN